MEILFKNMYEEIVTAGKLIVKMKQFMEKNIEIPSDFKSEIEETLEFLRNSARHYLSEYKSQVQFRKNLEEMYQEDEFPSRDENDYKICDDYACCEDCPNFDMCHTCPEEME